jgi:hypothetical protein
VSYELLKVIVQPVLLERDELGCIVGERVVESVAIYDLGQLAEYVDAFREQLRQQQEVPVDADK